MFTQRQKNWALGLTTVALACAVTYYIIKMLCLYNGAVTISLSNYISAPISAIIALYRLSEDAEIKEQGKISKVIGWTLCAIGLAVLGYLAVQYPYDLQILQFSLALTGCLVYALVKRVRRGDEPKPAPRNATPREIAWVMIGFYLFTGITTAGYIAYLQPQTEEQALQIVQDKYGALLYDRGWLCNNADNIALAPPLGYYIFISNNDQLAPARVYVSVTGGEFFMYDAD